MHLRGRELLRGMRPLPDGCRLIMDRAYEGNETRQLALDLGLHSCGPAAVHACRALAI